MGVFKNLVGLCLLMLSLSPFAQTWPSRPIRLIVAAPAGSSLDVIARAVGDRIKDPLGQAIVVENRPAAGGTQATDAVAKAAPDGYTLLLSFNGPLAFAPYLYPRLPYDPQKELAPVVLTTVQPNLLAVAADLPVTSAKELVAWMKARPGKLNYASVGNGSSSHLTMEYLKLLTGTFALHIPFNGAPPAVLSVMSGDTQALTTVPTVIMPQVKAGKMRALAVTGKTRYSLLPEVPTVAESGLNELRDFEAIAWNGILAPAGTPREVIARLNAEINQAFAEPAVRARLTGGGLESAGGTAEAFARLMVDEAAKWAPIIKRTGARLD